MEVVMAKQKEDRGRFSSKRKMEAVTILAAPAE